MSQLVSVLIGVAGLVCLVVGAALVAPSAGWAVAGAALVFVAVDARR